MDMYRITTVLYTWITVTATIVIMGSTLTAMDMTGAYLDVLKLFGIPMKPKDVSRPGNTEKHNNQIGGDKMIRQIENPKSITIVKNMGDYGYTGYTVYVKANGIMQCFNVLSGDIEEILTALYSKRISNIDVIH